MYHIYLLFTHWGMASQVALVVRNSPAMQETQEMQIQSLGQEDPLEEGMATCSSILDWRIPWTEESGGLQSKGPERVGHDWSNFYTEGHLGCFQVLLIVNYAVNIHVSAFVWTWISNTFG